MASINETSDNREINLIHPEVLPRENLIEILVERRLPLEEIENLEKSALVELFYKFVSPLPQRLHQLRRSKRRVPHSNSETNGARNLDLLGQNRARKRSPGDSSMPSTVAKFPKREKGDELMETETFDVNVFDQPSELDSADRRISLESTVVRLNRTSTSGQSKGKIVKLNRKSLGLQLDTTVAKRALEELRQENSSATTGEPLEIKYTAASNSKSFHEDVEQANAKFKKVAISYEDLEQTTETKKFKKVAITWP